MALSNKQNIEPRSPHLHVRQGVAVDGARGRGATVTATTTAATTATIVCTGSGGGGDAGDGLPRDVRVLREEAIHAKATEKEGLLSEMPVYEGCSGDREGDRIRGRVRDRVCGRSVLHVVGRLRTPCTSSPK